MAPPEGNINVQADHQEVVAGQQEMHNEDQNVQISLSIIQGSSIDFSSDRQGQQPIPDLNIEIPGPKNVDMQIDQVQEEQFPDILPAIGAQPALVNDEMQIEELHEGHFPQVLPAMPALPIHLDAEMQAAQDQGEQFPEGMLAMPAQNGNYLAHEFQLENLMDDQVIQEEPIGPDQELQGIEPLIPQNSEDATGLAFNVNLNLNVGFVTIRDQIFLNLDNPQYQGTVTQPNKPSPDLYRLWAKHFSPVGDMQQVVDIPRDWASFFIVMLLSPTSFEWAKAFLASKTWGALISCSKDAVMMSFALPKSCPKGAEVHCFAQSPSDESSDDHDSININHVADQLCASPPRNQVDTNVTNNLGSPLVETEVRRSLRIRTLKGGFMKPICAQNGCLACSASPPALPVETIKAIGESACMIAPGTLTVEVLKKKSKERRPIGDKKNSKKPTIRVKGEGKEKIEEVQDDSDEE